jgi:putative ABC transport system ATP-binding protein
MDPILKVENLSKSYRQGESAVNVLNDLNLEVIKGETVAILGQSGSGKSTLLSLLSGLDNADSGSISVSNQNIASLGEKELAKFRGENIGIIFQQFHLMNHMTALENVSLPLEIAKSSLALEKAKEALTKVGLSHRYDHYPSEMSGGENQRVAIARAFIVNPKILIADEPSGNLDQDTGDQVMSILFDQVKDSQMTLILVTHNKDLASKCQHIYELGRGKLNKLK